MPDTNYKQLSTLREGTLRWESVTLRPYTETHMEEKQPNRHPQGSLWWTAKLAASPASSTLPTGETCPSLSQEVTWADIWKQMTKAGVAGRAPHLSLGRVCSDFWMSVNMNHREDNHVCHQRRVVFYKPINLCLFVCQLVLSRKHDSQDSRQFLIRAKVTSVRLFCWLIQ